jgi:hypothetical protein
MYTIINIYTLVKFINRLVKKNKKKKKSFWFTGLLDFIINNYATICF